MQISLMVALVVLVIAAALFARALESGRVPEQFPQLASHYRIAFGALRRNRWLFIFPFLMAAIELLLGIPMALVVKRHQMDMAQWQNVSAFHWIPSEVFWPQAIRQITPAFKQALRGSTAPTGALFSGAWSVAVLALAALAMLLLPSKPDWLVDTEEKCKQELNFLRNLASFSVGSMVFAIVLLVFSQMMNTLELVRFGKGILLFIPGYLLAISEVWLLSLVISIYCKSAQNTLEHKETSFGVLFQEGIKIFPAMFAFELALMTLFMVLQAAELPIFGIMNSPGIGSYGRIRENWIEPAVWLLVAAAPLLIVVKNLERTNIVRAHIAFLKKHLITYLMFVLSGLALFFLPNFGSRIVDMLVTPLSMPSYDIGLLFSAVQAFLASWYLVAFLDWIRQSHYNN